jgi:hypothetical protein
VRPLEHRALCRGLGWLPPPYSPGHRLPLVALVPQWRQTYLDNRPTAPEAVAPEMGQRTKWLRGGPAAGAVTS